MNSSTFTLLLLVLMSSNLSQAIEQPIIAALSTSVVVIADLGSFQYIYFANASKTFSQAVVACEGHRATLASVVDDIESSFIQHLSTIEALGVYYIGVHDPLGVNESGNTDRFVFVDGTLNRTFFQAPFQHPWRSASPRGAFEHGRSSCISVGEEGLWSETSCDEHLSFICKRASNADTDSGTDDDSDTELFLSAPVFLIIFSSLAFTLALLISIYFKKTRDRRRKQGAQRTLYLTPVY